MRNKSKKYIIISSIIACIILYFIEQVLVMSYLVKILCKIIFFTVLPYIYVRLIKRSPVSDKIKINKKDLYLGAGLGVACFIVLISAYFFLKDAIDLNTIANELQSKSKVSSNNFLLVAFYITFVNSFLEEFFFRGFIFLNLYELGFKKLAYIFSSALFALYHIGIFKNWFNPWLIILAIFGLVSVGFIFDYIDTKSKNFINSWIVHILADAAIMLIGMRMFKIL
ncbi:CPBP family intramembrane glutamic endopeptidase [Proteiniborus sp. MB09-C3]|uniref:CPBP family intramembrane glutamic endopeptidase n=1 Tax=Proteiniborus sp. MB09-C3 TaxID=3050072 RepID=UPI002556C186|nr:CPBP family intramembrane glutamic endopeptidase [Proteiniborus sp. MB09-C3]WIV11835.1 CPBP family intramembrane metalloprotease [Proteiniborus sp. MB09-C3]